MKPRPLCRLCGGHIAKKTTSLQFGVAPRQQEKGHGRSEQPKTRADAQRLVNGEIVSIRYSTMARENSTDHIGTRAVTVPRYIEQVSYWDGESYVDPYFCNGEHARKFAYFAVENPAAHTQRYADALRRQMAGQ